MDRLCALHPTAGLSLRVSELHDLMRGATGCPGHARASHIVVVARRPSVQGVWLEFDAVFCVGCLVALVLLTSKNLFSHLYPLPPCASQRSQ